MTERRAQLAQTLARVRTRWRTVAILRAWAVASGAAALVIALALTAYLLFTPQNVGLVLLWSVALIAAAACLATLPFVLRRKPTDVQFARFIEERCPELEDLLVTAVTEDDRAASRPLVATVVEEAARQTADLDLERVVSLATVRRAGVRATAATMVLAALCGFAAGPAMQAVRLLTIYLFPERLGLQVIPGDAKLRAGEPLRIIVRIPGGAGVVPVLRVRQGSEWRDQAMGAGANGFVLALARVDQSFEYAVRAAGVTSRPYAITVVRPPRVERIDLQYVYPAAFGMKPRVEEDSGDIYGPAGTRVRVSVHTDKPITSAALKFSEGKAITLVDRGATRSASLGKLLEGELTITDDGSYRVALNDADGLTNPGDTEYFVRTLDDRPPNVRIVKPAGDRKVTPLEEVPIEARADDDFGVASLDLVYAVRGQKEKVIRFRGSGSGQTINGQQLLYLEDLKVQPGDFVTYYARARDVSRGKRSTEARSDIFFLEVTPFDEEFVSATSSSGAMPGGDASLEELIQAQKNVVTATWKLDRRAEDSGGHSSDDVRTIARAQGEVRRRTLGNVAEAQRAVAVRRRRSGQAQAPPPAAAADDPLSKAADAMGRAQQQLDALNTSDALPHEMTALNELMRAAAEDRRREVQRQQASGNGSGGSNRQQQDLSSLFDRELAREQATNYETPTSTETRGHEEQGDDEALRKVSELARRQDALNREQEQLARQKLSGEEMKRRLERLTREQSELRQQAEQLSQQLQQQARQGSPNGKGAQGGQSGSGGQETARSLQQASEEMRDAASDLRRQDSSRAGASGDRALQRLRELEGRMRGSKPDDRRRAVGDAQLESQQLADAQRRLANENRQAGRGGGNDPDASRKRAAEQRRLAGRMQRLEQSVRQLAGAPQSGGTTPKERSALDEAARALERQKLSDRMRNAAKAEAAGVARGNAEGEEQEIARALGDLSKQLGAANGKDDDSQRLSDQLARVKELRDKVAQLDRQLSEAAKGSQEPGDQPGGSSGTSSWQSAQQLVDQLRRDHSISVDQREIEGFHPGRSAPGTEAWKQDFARWNELKKQIVAALEKAEHTTAAQLRAQQSQDRLNAGTTQAVPEQYRGLVDEYYRALAAGEGP